MTVYYSPGAPNVFGPGTSDWNGEGHTLTPRERANVIGSGEGLGSANRLGRAGGGSPDVGGADDRFGEGGYQNGAPGSYEFILHQALASAEADASRAASEYNYFASGDLYADSLGIGDTEAPAWFPGAVAQVNTLGGDFGEGDWTPPGIETATFGDVGNFWARTAAEVGVKYGISTGLNMGVPGMGSILVNTPPGNELVRNVAGMGLNVLSGAWDTVSGAFGSGGPPAQYTGPPAFIPSLYPHSPLSGGSFDLGGGSAGNLGNLGGLGGLGNLGGTGYAGGLNGPERDYSGANVNPASGGPSQALPQGGAVPSGHDPAIDDFFARGIGATSADGKYGGREQAEGWNEYASTLDRDPIPGTGMPNLFERSQSQLDNNLERMREMQTLGLTPYRPPTPRDAEYDPNTGRGHDWDYPVGLRATERRKWLEHIGAIYPSSGWSADANRYWLPPGALEPDYVPQLALSMGLMPWLDSEGNLLSDVAAQEAFGNRPPGEMGG